MKGYVYLICNPSTDTYKIGRSCDVERRLKQLQTACSAELFIVDRYETEYPVQLESMMHRKFLNKRELNEWFRLDSNDIKSFGGVCKYYDEIIKSYNTEEPVK